MALRSWRGALLLALLLGVIVLAAAPVLTFPLGRDQGEFATIGRGILDGRIPYAQLWNPKPPAVFYVYAGAIAAFGETVAAIRAIDLIAVPLICLTLFGVGARLGGRRVGVWAALLFPMVYFNENFWTLTQNDGIAIVPMAAAAWCTLRTGDAEPGLRNGLGWAFGAGLAGALALWFKYPFALVVMGFVLAHLSRRWQNRVALLREAGAFAAGGLVIGLGGMALLAAAGALGDWLQSAQVTAGYTALAFEDGSFWERMWGSFQRRWVLWGVVMALVVRFPLHDGDARREGWQVVWWWLVGAVGAMAVQAKGYDYHWLPTLAPLSLLAADSLERLLTRLTQRLPRAYARIGSVTVSGLVMLSIVAIIALGTWGRAWSYVTGQESRMAYYADFRGGEFFANESQEVATYLRERNVPGDSLFIWGFRPEVYYLSDLNPATRFIFNFPLVADWYPQEWQQETVDTLWAAMPPYVLVLQADYLPWVTGRHEDSNTMLQDYTELNNWLMANYERDTQIGNFLIWRRINP